MEKVTKYRFYVKPLRRLTDEAIAEHLNSLGEAAFSSEVQKIVVGDEVVEGVYQLHHRTLMDLRRSEHYGFMRVFVQEGEGQIRHYQVFRLLTRKLSRTKAVKTVTKKLKTSRVRPL